MAISISFALETVHEAFVANGFQPKSQFGSTALGLPNGGYAVAYGNDFATGDTPHVSFFNADGTPVVGPRGAFSVPYTGPASGVQMIGQPSLSLTVDGNVLVTWLQDDTTWGSKLFSTVLNPADGTIVADQTLISNYDISEAIGTALGNGNQVYSFTSGPDVYLGFKNPDGSHIATYTLGDFPSFPENATVTELKTGELFITFRQTQAGFNSGVGTYYQYWSPSGGALGSATLLAASAMGIPAVAATADGGCVMVYSIGGVDGDGFMMNILPPVSAIDPMPIGSIWIDGEAGVSLSEPAVTVLDNGFILVTWTQQAAAGDSDVMARVFSRTGVAVTIDGSTDAFAIAGDTASEWASSVSAILAGQFIASWTEDGLDAEGTGIGAVVKELVRTAAGDADANVIKGSALKDIIHGLDGNDIMSGGKGKDHLYGGAGDDTYYSDGQDTIVELKDAGIDLVYSNRSIVLGDNIENLTLTGNAAARAEGNTLANIITGNDGNNHLFGGHDNLVDWLFGGLGNDTYDLGSSRIDLISESGGSGDTILSSVTRSLASNIDIENLTLTGPDAINGTGNSKANIITGNDADNRLSGGVDTESDWLRGGLGNDTYVLGASTNDRVSDSGGRADVILSSVTRNLSDFTSIENLTLTGNAAANGIGNARANVIVGNSGNNVLSGGLGSDTLDGGEGSDMLIGGQGADLFVFSSPLDASSNVDLIADFSGADKIVLDDDVFTELQSGLMYYQFLSVDGDYELSDITAIRSVVYLRNSGELVYGDASGVITLFARLAAGTQLQFDDFVIAA